MKLIIINGPNLNLLGQRDLKIYGRITLAQIEAKITKMADRAQVKVRFFQSNHEGGLIDFIQENFKKADGILINPGALTHYGYSLRDCLEDSRLPVVEVHLSNTGSREDFRRFDVFDGIVAAKIQGLREKSYFEGFKKLIKIISPRG